MNERKWSPGAEETATGSGAQEPADGPLPRRLPRRRPVAPPTAPTPSTGGRPRDDDDVVVTWAAGMSPGLSGTILTGEHILGPIPDVADPADPAGPPGPPVPTAEATLDLTGDEPVVVLDDPVPAADRPVTRAPAPAGWLATSSVTRSGPAAEITTITSEHPALTNSGATTVAMATAEHVALAVAGDAFETFYRAEKPRVVAVVSSLTGDRSAAEDIVQEAFATAMRRWATVSGYERPGDWVKRVAVNRAISRFRRRQSESRALTRFAGRTGDEDVRSLDGDDAWDDDPLWAAVRKLPRRQAQAVVLVYVDDLSLERVAEILECSIGSVKTHLHRARQRLAVELGESFEPSGTPGKGDP